MNYRAVSTEHRVQEWLFGQQELYALEVHKENIGWAIILKNTFNVGGFHYIELPIIGTLDEMFELKSEYASSGDSIRVVKLCRNYVNNKFIVHSVILRR